MGTLSLRIAVTGLMVALLSPVAPVTADDGWKSTRNFNGERIRWHSCTVKYAIDLNEAPASQRRDIRTAIRDAEEASGIDFKLVAWKKSDLQFALLDGNYWSFMAVTKRRTIRNETVSAVINVYHRTYGYPRATRVDTYRHEIGHVLGLAHVKGSDTMSARLVKGQSTQAGWRTGLRWLYKRCYCD